MNNQEFAPSLIHLSACRDLKIVGLQTGGIAHSLGFHPLPASLRALLPLVTTFSRGRGIPAWSIKLNNSKLIHITPNSKLRTPNSQLAIR
jgi:hypothetical protein